MKSGGEVVASGVREGGGGRVSVCLVLQCMSVGCYFSGLV